MIARQLWSAAAVPMLVMLASPVPGLAAPAQTTLTSPPAPATPDDDDIVVQGTRKSLGQMLRQTLDIGPQEQLARYEDGFCPHVGGFPAEWSPIIEQAVRNNAAEAGVRVKEPGCLPNAQILFTDQPQQFMAALEKANPSLLAHLSRTQRQALLGKKRAVYSSRIVRQVDREGNALIDGSPREGIATRTSVNVRSDIVRSVVVIDINQSPGKSLRQIADFATMHLLLNLTIKTLDEANPSSILSLFMPHEGTAMPARLSVVDRATIHGLYFARSNNFTVEKQRKRIIAQIKKEYRATAAAE